MAVREVNGVMFNTSNPRTINGKKFYWNDHSKDKSKLQGMANQLRGKGFDARILPTYERGVIWWTLFIRPRSK